MTGEWSRALSEHLSQALVNDLIEWSGPAGALVLSALLTTPERAMGSAAGAIALGLAVDASFAVGTTAQRTERNTRAKFIGALHATRA